MEKVSILVVIYLCDFVQKAGYSSSPLLTASNMCYHLPTLTHRRCLQENRIASDNVKYQQKIPLPNPTNTPYPTPITSPLPPRYSISHVLKRETKGRSYHILSENRAQKETPSYVTIFIRKLSSFLQF